MHVVHIFVPFMRIGLRVDLTCFDFLTDSNLVFALLVLQDILQDANFLTSRNLELKEEGFLGFRVVHQETEIFFEIWMERVPDHRELYPCRTWL